LGAITPEQGTVMGMGHCEAHALLGGSSCEARGSGLMEVSCSVPG